ncbi:MAG: TauD/TfdA family dioxygenase [Sphingomonadales bacterium]|nr:TauD/TfdA family dioxygenase [Sphingomonadales bacterium]
MRFTPLHSDFGVEVHDFDVQAGGAAEDVAVLRSALDAHDMLLLRGAGRVSPERQTEITGWFGPPAPVDNAGDGQFVSVLDNAEEAGSFMLPFHSDLTYTDCPIKVICLHAIALPERPTSTSFVSNRAAWNRLSTADRARLAPLHLRHLYVSSMPSLNMPDMAAIHPLAMPNPRTGAMLLVVTEHHADRIVELPGDESRALIDRLLADLYAPACQYEHVWRPDDLLIWDNLALQHARRERSDPGAGKRALQRVALAETGIMELVARARAAA